MKVDGSSVDLFALLKIIKMERSPDEVDWEQAAREIGILETSERRGRTARLLFEQHLRQLKNVLDEQFPLWYLE